MLSTKLAYLFLLSAALYCSAVATDPDVGVRYAVIDALETLNAREQLPELVKALDDPLITNRAAVAVKKLSAKE